MSVRLSTIVTKACQRIIRSSRSVVVSSSTVVAPRSSSSSSLSLLLLLQKEYVVPISQTSSLQIIRTYRGEAKDGTSTLSPEEMVLYERAKPRSDAILQHHHKLPDVSTIDPSALYDPRELVSSDNNNNTTKPNISTEELELDIRRKRLIYRSKQRGWLEVDLLLGTWANDHVMQLSASELDEYEAFVNYETIDIYNIITLRLDVPEHLKTADGSGIVERIQQWARTSPLGKADPEQYKKVKEAAKLI